MSLLPSNNISASLYSQTMLTAISMSAIATNGVVPGQWANPGLQGLLMVLYAVL
jgi:hypothetical protein